MILIFLFVLQAIAMPYVEIYTLPAGWRRHVGCPPDDEALRLQISLVQRNISLLQSALYRLSDPESPSYGKYLDRDEVDDLFKPTRPKRKRRFNPGCEELESQAEISIWRTTTSALFHQYAMRTTCSTQRSPCMQMTMFGEYGQPAIIFLRA